MLKDEVFLSILKACITSFLFSELILVFCLFVLNFYLFLAALGLCCCAWASRCSVFSCCRACVLGMWASVAAAHGP